MSHRLLPANDWTQLVQTERKAHFSKKWVSFWQPTLTWKLVNGLTQTCLGLYVRLDSFIQPSIPLFHLGSDLYHNLSDLLTFSSSLLIFFHIVISSNKILACLILCWHLLKNRWRTQTNIVSLVPNARSLRRNSLVWPTVPFVIRLLLTSCFSLSLLLICAPPTLFTFFPCSVISCP